MLFGNFTSSWMICLLVSSWSIPKNGKLPDAKKYKVTPKDQISHSLPYFPVKTSGAKNKGVPIKFIFDYFLISSGFIEIPKSMNWTWPLESNMILAGLISLWIIPRVWQWFKALDNFIVQYASCSSWKGYLLFFFLFSSNRDWRSPPSQRDMQMYT